MIMITVHLQDPMRKGKIEVSARSFREVWIEHSSNAGFHELQITAEEARLLGQVLIQQADSADRSADRADRVRATAGGS